MKNKELNTIQHLNQDNFLKEIKVYKKTKNL